MAYVAGIDLGTTFTAAAVCRGAEERAEIVSLGDRAASVPSVVLLRDDTTILIGDAANRRAVLEPDRVAREFKRRLGDPTPLLLGGSPHSPESLQAKLLRSVYDAIVQHEGGPPDHVTVTYPANWGPYKKELLSQTLRMAGLEDATTVTEPEAAAIHYASNERVEPGEVIAVYDLGGGTFDAAVLRKIEDGFQSLGVPEGLEHLGGVDVDHSILQHVNAALGGALDEVDLEDPTARADLARLRADCAEAKEALSTDTEVTIPVSVAGKRTEVRLTRAELDQMVAPVISETIDALRRAISSAGLTAEDVGRILLVGGASRMPIVSRMVMSELGRPVFLDAHPKHAIALGAAIAASSAVKAIADAPTQASVLCAACGAPLLGDDVFCGECGTPVGQEAAAVAPAPVVADELPPPPVASKRKFPRLVLPKRGPVTLAVLLTVIASVAGYALFLRPQAEASGVLYQDPVSKGPSPFTEPAVDERRPSASSEDDEGAAPKGPFGGSGVLTKCDKNLLKKFLNENPDRKKAWTGVLGVDVHDFSEYMNSLRPATITVDTRVTNHGFKNGRAFELQSILAKGTAVLVDPKGKIVTRCYCGNPLLPPRPLGRSTCNGCPDGYVPPAQCVGNDCYRVDAPEDKEQDSEPETEENRNASPLGGGSGGSPSRSTQSNPTTQDSGSEPQVFTFNGNTSTEDEGDSSNGNDSFQNPEHTPLPTRPPQNCGDGVCSGDTVAPKKTPTPPN